MSGLASPKLEAAIMEIAKTLSASASTESQLAASAIFAAFAQSKAEEERDSANSIHGHTMPMYALKNEPIKDVP